MTNTETKSRFYWYRLNDYGCADVLEDSPAVCADVDANPSRYYGNAEGAIIHGGVKATAFNRKTEMTYDAAEWLRTGKMVPAGERTTTTITAQAKP